MAAAAAISAAISGLLRLIAAYCGLLRSDLMLGLVACKGLDVFKKVCVCVCV